MLQRGLLGPLLRGADPTPPAALLGLVQRLPWLSLCPLISSALGSGPSMPPHSPVAATWQPQWLESEHGAPLRIGILGAARIAPLALIKPAKENAEVVVAAVAARDASRAQAFAAKHDIARVHDNYDALIADPDLDAIYNPLPNGLHGKWTRAALAAGKHVLCEKPFTANAAEAREIAELAAKSDRVVMEAFHYRYHPLTLRVEQIIASGELGKLKRVEAALCFPLPKFSDIRYNYSLAGGATMDAGCYAVHMVRTFGGSTPEVVSAQAKLRDPQVDRAMTAELRFAGGHTGRVRCSMWSSRSAADQRQGDRRPRRAACAQSGDAPALPSALGPIGRRQTCGAFPAPRLLRVSARRFRRGSAARRTGEDDPARRDREHDRHRCDLSRCRPPASRAQLKVIAAVGLTSGVLPPRMGAPDRSG